MHVPASPSQHLTYCLNVHPGESWQENMAAIRSKALRVRDLVCPDKPCGLGLRLANDASLTLSAPEERQAFKQFLSDHNLYVFTINGFPYGAFHNTRVKEMVYRPDWRDRERVDYTMRLADILADLLPEGVTGSISTVPCSYKTWITGQADVERMAAHLTETARHLARILDRTGKLIHIGLEPEPDCFLERTPEAVAFFERHLFRGPHAALVRHHIGICLDTCHAALQFETLADSLERLCDSGIRVSKIQLSAAPRVNGSEATPEHLACFCDPVYLHQVKIREASGTILSCPDLPDALALHGNTAGPADEWRIHFHIPLYLTAQGPVGSTIDQLTPDFFESIRRNRVEHLEIETYTFDVLPPEMRVAAIETSIAAEYEWVLARLAVTPAQG